MFISSKDEYDKKKKLSAKLKKILNIGLAVLSIAILITLIILFVYIDTQNSYILMLVFVGELITIVVYGIVSAKILTHIDKSIKVYEKNDYDTNKKSDTKTTNHSSVVFTTAKTQNANEKCNYYINNEDKIKKIAEKYSKSVFNYIKQLQSLSNNRFSFIEDSNVLLKPYWKNSSQLFKKLLHNDGFMEYYDDCEFKALLYKNLDEITSIFVNGLKTRIVQNGDWKDGEDSLPCIIYKVVRNSIIQYFHDYYKNNIGWETIEEYCRNVKNIKDSMFYFTCYYMYETDIDLSIIPTYNKFMKNANTEVEKIKQQNIEGSLFNQFIESPNATDNATYVKQETITEEQINNMSGKEFEKFMEHYFVSKGYNVVRTPLSGDYGIDLIIEHEFGKIGVQLKRYNAKVSLSAVQEVVAGLSHYGLNSGMVITNNYFQPSAIQLAKDNNITLWNRDVLLEKISI